MEKLDKKSRDLLKVICYGIILFFAFWYFPVIKDGFNKVGRVLQPFIIGGMIAYLVSIPMNYFERKLVANFPDKKYRKRISALSLFVSWVLIICFLVLFLNILIPRIATVILSFFNRWPEFVRETYETLNSHSITRPYADKFYEYVNSFGWYEVRNAVMNFITDKKTDLFSLTTGVLNSVSSSLISIFTIIVFSIFVLIYKDMLKTNGTRILYALMSEKRADYLNKVLSLSYNTFKDYIFSRLIAVVTLSALTFVGMFIMGIPNAGVISLFVGVSDLIPIFGPIVGAGLSAVIIFLESPIKALIFLIYDVIVQQIQENIIYPAIAGEKIGLPAVWVLAAITIGGSLFGIWGMLVGIPVASIIYTLFHEFIDNRLKDKNVTDKMIDEKKNEKYTMEDIDSYEAK